jgi:hypothetical protein
MTYEANVVTNFTIIARSKNRFDFFDYSDTPWDKACVDDLDVDEADMEIGVDEDVRGNDDALLHAKTPGTKIVDSILAKDKLFRQLESEEEIHLKPKYKAVQEMHRTIWDIFNEVEILRRRRHSISQRIAAMENN